MTQSAKSPQAPDDSGEIDRIIQEIEEMEKSIDEVQPKAAETAKVVPLRAETPPAATAEAEPAAPSLKDPIGFDQALAVATAREEGDGDTSGMAATGDGSLALSVGGCTNITLEFTQSGMTVTLRYENDALVIKTDSGAEFRVPFRKAA